MLIDHINWKTKTKDYSAKLAQCKAEMGAMYKMHPDHDPLDFPWMYEDWRLDIIEENRKKNSRQ